MIQCGGINILGRGFLLKFQSFLASKKNSALPVCSQSFSQKTTEILLLCTSASNTGLKSLGIFRREAE